jgi:glutamine amidotransferase
MGTTPDDATEPVVDAPELALRGLALIRGRVTRLRARQVPQIGWNAVEPSSGASDPLLEAAGLDVAYFANSFACRPDDDAVVRAWSEHDGDRFPVMVRTHRTVGVQFHPEKSSAPGVRFVHAWLDEARRSAR